MSSRVGRPVWFAVLVLWVVGVGAGLEILWSYENEPGPAALAPARWPAGSGIPAPAGRPTLILALHPQCPCSAATLGELERLLARVTPRPDVHILFVAGRDASVDWVQSATWRHASRIPGVTVVRDDGAEAKRFGARVSGQALVYDAGGTLQFSGGLTGSRGHEGDNAGRSAAEAALAGRPHPPTAFVFGCFLFDAEGNATPESRS